ncbi:histidine phosphatase family protein [Limibacter armeniacum]|uniref:SixA phosphatase family protein n=1 Tax=Limibacter armeniacum TaxID=466084 RepID=UPI002FE675BA
MKTLYLVRHAKSSWDHPELSDFDRPLNKRGLKAAPLMGKVLHEKGVIPQQVISSSAKRAKETAITIVKEIGLNPDNIIYADKIYEASTNTLLTLIKSCDDKVTSLMLFGHNPTFTDLANVLTDEYIDNIPTAGIVGISFDTDHWKEAKKGKLLFFDFPKNYKD